MTTTNIFYGHDALNPQKLSQLATEGIVPDIILTANTLDCNIADAIRVNANYEIYITDLSFSDTVLELLLIGVPIERINFACMTQKKSKNPNKRYTCFHLFRTLVNFGEHGIRFCCDNYANSNGQSPIFPNLGTGKQTADLINRIRQEMWSNERIFDSCINCVRLMETERGSDMPKIHNVNFSIYPSVCNISCVYCGLKSVNSLDLYKTSRINYPARAIEMLRELRKLNQVVDDNDEQLQFHLAAGEPSIMPHKEILWSFIKEHCCYIYTNCVKFCENIANNLSANPLSYVITSIDSGTCETWKSVKGPDLFNNVLTNIEKYSKYGKIRLKYILLPGINTREEDFEGVAQIMVRNNIKEPLMIDSDAGREVAQDTLDEMFKLIKILKKYELPFNFGTSLGGALRKKEINKKLYERIYDAVTMGNSENIVFYGAGEVMCKCIEAVGADNLAKYTIWDKGIGGTYVCGIKVDYPNFGKYAENGQIMIVMITDKVVFEQVRAIFAPLRYDVQHFTDWMLAI